MNKLTRFVADYVGYVLKGSPKFYAWMGALSVLILAMLYGFYLQNTEGLIVTGMTSQIHEGLYFANLVFLVGVAAGAVTIVFPASTTTKACTRSACSARCWPSRPSSW